MSAVLDRPQTAPVRPERPAGPGRPRRRVSLPALAWRQFRRAPVTVCFLAAVWAAGLGWAIAGVSHGGTCAIQLATQAPRLYRFFVDISGQAGPTLGSRQLTISRAFGGDAAAFARVDPLLVLAGTRFPRSAGVFVAGASDGIYTPQQRAVYRAARRAGMDVTFRYLPGGHDWAVGRDGLAATVGWLDSRLGITGRPR